MTTVVNPVAQACCTERAGEWVARVFDFLGRLLRAGRAPRRFVATLLLRGTEPVEVHTWWCQFFTGSNKRCTPSLKFTRSSVMLVDGRLTSPSSSTDYYMITSSEGTNLFHSVSYDDASSLPAIRSTSFTTRSLCNTAATTTSTLTASNGNSSSSRSTHKIESPLSQRHHHQQQQQPHQRRQCWNTSNVFFFVGSILYVGLAVWDIRQERPSSGGAGDGTTPEPTLSWLTPYVALSVAAALCYVADAATQVCVSSSSSSTPSSSFEALATSSSSTAGVGAGDDSSRSSSGRENHNHLVHRMRKSQKCLKLSVGLFFGLGALLELISALTTTLNDSRWSNWLTVCSAHSYLINAILLWAGKQVSFTTVAETVEMVGDGLFLIGSAIDVSLSYFYIGESNEALSSFVHKGCLLSSMLWLVDALLYLAADMCAAAVGAAGGDDSVVGGRLPHDGRHYEETAVVKDCGDLISVPLLQFQLLDNDTFENSSCEESASSIALCRMKYN